MNSTLAQIIRETQAKPNGLDQWLGHCPAHGSRRNRDLSIALRDRKILLNCFATCPKEAVCRALGLVLRDLFTDTPVSHAQRPTPRPPKPDLSALAFQFELGALDRRLRAERVLETAAHFTIEGLTEPQLDRVMDTIAAAFADQERAEFLETIADDLRMKAYQERSAHHAA